MDDLKKNLEDVLVSLLFVSGDGLQVDYIAEKLNIKKDTIDKAISKLKEKYSGDNPLHIITYRGKVQLTSNPKFSDYIVEVLNPIKEKQLTKTALETIAIICYKQPITKLEVENIRGTNCDYAIQLLLKHNLIEVVGRKDAVGKPLLFGTTDEFLKRFELDSLESLPKYEDVLERIQVIHNENNNGDGLYRDFSIDDYESEDKPEFLEGEDVQTFEADGTNTEDSSEQN